MSNRTTHKLKGINAVLTDVVDRQTLKIARLEGVIQQHEAAERILNERLELSSARANDSEARVTELEVQLADLTTRYQTLEAAHKINTETLSVFAAPTGYVPPPDEAPGDPADNPSDKEPEGGNFSVSGWTSEGP